VVRSGAQRGLAAVAEAEAEAEAEAAEFAGPAAAAPQLATEEHRGAAVKDVGRSSLPAAGAARLRFETSEPPSAAERRQALPC